MAHRGNRLFPQERNCAWHRGRGLLPVLAAAALVAGSLFAAGDAAAGTPDYREFPVVGSRVAVWVIAQLHLLFAAFVLAVPMFAVIIEFIGFKTKDKRYDRLAHEFTKLLSASFSFTATLGASLTFMLVFLYPRFMTYFTKIFGLTYLPYTLLFFAEAGFLYSYYYGWGKFSPRVHLLLGLGLNVVGTCIMALANSWLTFMMSPRGVDEAGNLTSLQAAMTNFTWMPINIHRFIANIAFGGSIAAAYAGVKFLHAKSDEERAHYDWMGYIGNFVAICAFLPLPFAGYYLAFEIYGFNQGMGMTMMGGAFSWLFVIQAMMIGVLFLGANFYFWLSMGRIEGTQVYRKFVKYLLLVGGLCTAAWATPRYPISSAEELGLMGGPSHPILKFFGQMSSKNTAVNLFILTTFLSFYLFRRSGKRPVVSWAKSGVVAQMVIFFSCVTAVIFIGVDGYFVDTSFRINVLSPVQVLSVLITMIAVVVLDIFIFRGAEKTGEVRWGRMPAISQYVLFLLAISFTWLMGLMGYVRSGLRMEWHVYGVLRDDSAHNYTPSLGFATQVVSVTVLIFFVFIAFVFYLASLPSLPDYGEKEGGEGAHGHDPEKAHA